MLTDVRENYEAVPSSRAFDRLYYDAEWDHMFAVLHKRLNEHFTAITGRAATTRHYWADKAPALIAQAWTWAPCKAGQPSRAGVTQMYGADRGRERGSGGEPGCNSVDSIDMTQV